MNDSYYMNEAIKEAQQAAEENEVPIGAIIVYHDQIIARAHNKREAFHQTTAHAEILAIEEVNKYFNSWHLDDCIMYVTLEPCLMCTGAIVQSRMKKVVIGALENRWPGMTKLLNKFKFNHYVEIEFSNEMLQCSTLLSDYFKKKRNKEKNL